MSIVPASYLSGSDLALLGNNLRPAIRRDHDQLSAVNRSLAVHQEQVGQLHRIRIRRPVTRPVSA